MGPWPRQADRASLPTLQFTVFTILKEVLEVPTSSQVVGVLGGKKHIPRSLHACLEGHQPGSAARWQHKPPKSRLPSTHHQDTYDFISTELISSRFSLLDT